MSQYAIKVELSGPPRTSELVPDPDAGSDDDHRYAEAFQEARRRARGAPARAE